VSRILIVDDDRGSCRTLQLHYRGQGHEALTASNARDGLALAVEARPEVVILDIRMPGRSGLDALPELRRVVPDSRVIMVTAYHDMDNTIAAMQRGADDYIQKPIDIDELDAAVAKALRSAGAGAGSELVIAEPAAQAADKSMVGHSRVMKEVFKSIGLAAASGITVLITGESGTGKELVARAIHHASPHADGPFVAVNCAALVESLLESDMFGHEKGAFTGAFERHPGKFALADGGTIFLDEVSELSPVVQAKLLRVLQEREYTPVGAKHSRPTRARVIAATNVDLRQLVLAGVFREDLYYRLQVATIHLPPLRERREDLPDLVRSLLARHNRHLHRHIRRVSAEVLRALEAYAWPGNVRELENVLMQAAAVCPGHTITGDEIPEYLCGGERSGTRADPPLAGMSLAELERRHVLRVLEATGWHRGRACEVLGISRPRLRRMMRHFDLSPADDAVDASGGGRGH